ncbi:MAG: HPr(Ser) kinase/phosphatase [Clostridia bacterium]|nr:HPr(Ser) kinase/phosphatase [Clostridia bacterium]MBQ8268473.1 HPr(Ser) kinase/phosphatase [Clostridia bacterium]
MNKEEIYEVSLDKVIGEFHLETIFLPDLPENIKITCARVNQPGLQMVGFYDHYEQERLQIIGKVENLFLAQLPKEERTRRLEDFFRSAPVGVIVTSSIDLLPETVNLAQKYRVPLLRTAVSTSDFMAALISYLNVQLGPRITRHGVLVEVYGEGVLLLGDSGVGKSETAIELVKRGHRLIADDAVEIKRVSATTLVGRAPEIIRHYVELRGIGIVDVRRLFGMGAIKETEKIDMVINLEPWEQGKMYDRFGLEERTTELLGIQVPTIVIPVCPGRNLSVVIEVAAMNNRQKRMGYNTAEEFNKRLMESMGVNP